MDRRDVLADNVSLEIHALPRLLLAERRSLLGFRNQHDAEPVSPNVGQCERHAIDAHVQVVRKAR